MTDHQLINRVEKYSKFLDNSSIHITSSSQVIAEQGNCAGDNGRKNIPPAVFVLEDEAQKHEPKDLKQLTTTYINE
jgi:hypothetical protein